MFRRTDLICGLQMLAFSPFVEERPPFRRLPRCWIYLDNGSARSALVRSGPDADFIAFLADRPCEIAHIREICVWLPRVRPKINPSDLPTRGRPLPFVSRVGVRFGSTLALFSLCRSQPALASCPFSGTRTRLRRPLSPFGSRRRVIQYRAKK